VETIWRFRSAASPDPARIIATERSAARQSAYAGWRAGLALSLSSKGGRRICRQRRAPRITHHNTAAIKPLARRSSSAGLPSGESRICERNDGKD
jgi:hypothetical protein